MVQHRSKKGPERLLDLASEGCQGGSELRGGVPIVAGHRVELDDIDDAPGRVEGDIAEPVEGSYKLRDGGFPALEGGAVLSGVELRFPRGGEGNEVLDMVSDGEDLVVGQVQEALKEWEPSGGWLFLEDHVGVV